MNALIADEVFDLAAFGDRLEHDRELMWAVAEVFLEDLGLLLEQLRESTVDGDCSRSADIAHKIKGSAANIGGMALSASAKNIEEACRAGQSEDLGALFADLDACAGALREAMDRRMVRA